jgi:hypothetical protein
MECAIRKSRPERKATEQRGTEQNAGGDFADNFWLPQLRKDPAKQLRKAKKQKKDK